MGVKCETQCLWSMRLTANLWHDWANNIDEHDGRRQAVYWDKSQWCFLTSVRSTLLLILEFIELCKEQIYYGKRNV